MGAGAGPPLADEFNLIEDEAEAILQRDFTSNNGMLLLSAVKTLTVTKLEPIVAAFDQYNSGYYLSCYIKN